MWCTAGTGKTYAVEAALERLRDTAAPDPASSSGEVSVCTLAFPSKPTMRLVADALLTALTGAAPPRSRNRFQLISALTDLLSGPRRLVVIGEAQRLNGDCIELSGAASRRRPTAYTARCSRRTSEAGELAAAEPIRIPDCARPLFAAHLASASPGRCTRPRRTRPTMPGPGRVP